MKRTKKVVLVPSGGGEVAVAACCRKLPKFCKCPPGTSPMCGICGGDKSKGAHFPADPGCAPGRPPAV